MGLHDSLRGRIALHRHRDGCGTEILRARITGPKGAKYLRGRLPLEIVFKKEIGSRSAASKGELRDEEAFARWKAQAPIALSPSSHFSRGREGSSQERTNYSPAVAVVPSDHGVRGDGGIEILVVFPSEVEGGGHGFGDVAGRAEALADHVGIGLGRPFLCLCSGNPITSFPLDGLTQGQPFADAEEEPRQGIRRT